MEPINMIPQLALLEYFEKRQNDFAELDDWIMVMRAIQTFETIDMYHVKSSFDPQSPNEHFKKIPEETKRRLQCLISLEKV